MLIVARAQTPFAWGTADCAMWAFDAVRAHTGRDPAPDLRGAYGTALQATRRLVAEGGWPRVCARRVGPALLLSQAQDGDVVQVNPAHCAEDMADIGSLGVVWHGQIVAQGAEGLVSLPMHAALGCWRPHG